MVDVKYFFGRWFIATDEGVFEIIANGGEDPWLKKIEPVEPGPGQVSADMGRTLQTWRDEGHS